MEDRHVHLPPAVEQQKGQKQSCTSDHYWYMDFLEAMEVHRNAWGDEKSGRVKDANRVACWSQLGTREIVKLWGIRTVVKLLRVL